MSSTITLGLLIKTAVSGAGYGVFAELGSNIERLKAKTQQAKDAQTKLGQAMEAMRRQGRPNEEASTAYRRLGEAIGAAERRAQGLEMAMARQAEHSQRLRSLWGEALGVAGAAMGYPAHAGIDLTGMATTPPLIMKLAMPVSPTPTLPRRERG